MTSLFARNAVVAALLASVGACGGGDDATERPPWDRDGAAPGGKDAGAAARAEPGFTPRKGIDLGGARSLGIGGHQVALLGIGLAALETELNLDDRMDVVVVGRPLLPDGTPKPGVLADLTTFYGTPNRLVVASGEQDPVQVARVCAPRASLRQPTSKSIVADVADDCPGAFIRTTGWIPTGSGRARFRATLEGATDPGEITLAPGDLDEDGAEDVEVRIRARMPDGVVELPIRYVERATGLTADPTEPEATIAKLVRAVSKGGNRQRAADRAARLRALIAARSLLCEGEAAGMRLTVGAGRPHRCETSQAVGSAIEALVRLEVERGDPLAARSALGALRGNGVRLGERARTDLERAVDAMTPVREARVVQGPTLDAVPAVRAGALRFLDDTTLLVGGHHVFRVETGATEPAAEETNLRVISPDGGTVVQAVADRCGEAVAVLCASGARCDPGDGEGGQLVALIPPGGAPRPAAAEGAPKCTLREANQPRILAWRPEGIVWMARGAPDLLVTSVGNGPASVARRMAPPFDSPPGGPFADRGRRAVFTDASGIWLREDGTTPRYERVVVEGLSAPEIERLTDWTLSPSGALLAAVGARDGAAHVFRLSAAAAPAPPSPSAP